MTWVAVSPFLIVGGALVLVGLERLFPYDRRQRLFRTGFWTDLIGYAFVQSYLLGLCITWLITWIDRSSGLSRLQLLSDWPLPAQLAFFVVTQRTGDAPLAPRQGSGPPGKNFSTKLALWDWLFGTAYLPEHKPSGYGLDEPGYPRTGVWLWLEQHVHAFLPERLRTSGNPLNGPDWMQDAGQRGNPAQVATTRNQVSASS